MQRRATALKQAKLTIKTVTSDIDELVALDPPPHTHASLGAASTGPHAVKRAQTELAVVEALAAPGTAEMLRERQLLDKPVAGAGGQKGQTLLHRAVEACSPLALQALLKAKADPNTQVRFPPKAARCRVHRCLFSRPTFPSDASLICPFLHIFPPPPPSAGL